jgi:hypothetical protein
VSKRESIIPVERIENRILYIRDLKVMLDSDLAVLYGVSVGRLNEAVKRKQERFPSGFMFQLTKQEFTALKSQIAIANDGRGGRRTTPYAFTEQGVAMLSSVLNSDRAIQVNIAIMNTFVRMREMLLNNARLAGQLREIEERMDTQEMNTILLMDKLRKIEGELVKSIKTGKTGKIGFIPDK